MSNRVLIDQSNNTVTTDTKSTQNNVIFSADNPDVVTIIENTSNIVTIGVPGPRGSSPINFATTGSNTFYGLQTVSASSVDLSALDIHVKDDGLWAFRMYNDTYSSSSIGLASWIDNTGISFLGTETNKPLYIYSNAQYYQPNLIISSSGVTISDVLILPYKDPLPEGNSIGSLALSGSGTIFVGMYLYNGTSWIKVSV